MARAPVSERRLVVAIRPRQGARPARYPSDPPRAIPQAADKLIHGIARARQTRRTCCLAIYDFAGISPYTSCRHPCLEDAPGQGRSRRRRRAIGLALTPAGTGFNVRERSTMGCRMHCMVCRAFWVTAITQKKVTGPLAGLSVAAFPRERNAPEGGIADSAGAAGLMRCGVLVDRITRLVLKRVIGRSTNSLIWWFDSADGWDSSVSIEPLAGRSTRPPFGPRREPR